MFEFALGVGAGLIIGWTVLPQPIWIQKLYSHWFSEGR